MMIVDSSRFAVTGASYNVDYLVVAGSGGRGSSTQYAAGRGGAGGLLQGSVGLIPGVTYTITVGAAGANATGAGNTGYNGGNSAFDSIAIAIGGGGGGGGGGSGGQNGGSGGGVGSPSSSGGGLGTPGQGFDGSFTSSLSSSAGGGGAGGPAVGTVNGPGLSSSITGTPVTYARGGVTANGEVIIAYPGAQRGAGGAVTSVGGNTIHRFTSSGTYTA